MREPRSVALLGATGSIGTQSLDVLRREPERFRLVSVAGGQRLDELVSIAREFSVTRVGVTTAADRRAVAAELPGVDVVVGDVGLTELAGDADIVINAIIGFAGLPVTMAALSSGRRLALANKESLIAAAPLVASVRETPGAEIVPIDSEHCAIHQCLAGSRSGRVDVRRLLLTASGGPFREWGAEQLRHVTRDDALRHPTWSMGPKITIDSSTLMNKGLEVLEASALFGVEASRIDVVVRPQSIVHSMVEYVDGSILAQLSRPDMRLPIAYCLGLPERLDHAWGAIDFAAALTLTFEPPDHVRFPALSLAYEVARRGGGAAAWFSAANEVAVDAFLSDALAWHEIVAVVAATLDRFDDAPVGDVASLRAADARAREVATSLIAR